MNRITKMTDNREEDRLLFLGILGSTPIAAFVNLITIVSGIFTIYSFIETRNDKKEKEESDSKEISVEWKPHLEDLSSRMEKNRKSIKEVICRLDAVHAKNKNISPDCLPFIRPVNQAHLATTDFTLSKLYHHNNKKKSRTNKTNSLINDIYTNFWR